MATLIYPGSVPEFRFLVKADGAQVLQVRYINTVQGYTGKWQGIPVVLEAETKPAALLNN
jgi:hypothetical protein